MGDTAEKITEPLTSSDNGIVQQRLQERGTPWKGITAASILVVAIAAYALGSDELPPEIAPFKAPKLTALAQFQGAYREKMLWGTYLSGLYFGMRTKEAHGLQAGLMWFDPDRQDALQNIRHQAQERDGLAKFGWERHDGESFGRQEVHDGSLHMTTSFVKDFDPGSFGGDWGLRVSAAQASQAVQKQRESSAEDTEEQRVSLLFYISDIHESGRGTVSVVADENGQGSHLASGNTIPFGGWSLHARSSSGEALPKLRYLGIHSQHLHNLTAAVSARVSRPSLLATSGRRTRADAFGSPRTSLPDEVDHDSNVAVFQLTASLPFSVDFIFTGSLSPPESQGWVQYLKSFLWRDGILTHTYPVRKIKLSHKERIEALSGRNLGKLLQKREEAFDIDFEAKFGDLLNRQLPEGALEASKAGLSNMLGGIGYFFGSSQVRVGGKVVETPPAALLTAVPSRSFFPRGFLWDEGFHQLLIRKWNKRLSREILAHWLDLLNAEGWIAREQILGEEARSRVPSEFVVQDPTAANPPTLFLALADMAHSILGQQQGSDAEAHEDLQFLKAAFPRMQAWLGWFIQSQPGKLPGTWRWRGRSLNFLPDPISGQPTSYSRELNPKTLTSGLDDYPRASHPSEDERHIDLYCWMSLATSSMTSIAQTLGLKSSKISTYKKMSEQLADFNHLNRMHYDLKRGQYLDWGNHTEDVRLDWRYVQVPEEWRAQAGASRMRHDMVRFVGKPPKPSFVPHYGYVSLFPLLMRLLPPQSPELASQLHHLRTGQILTPYGLRSLSLGSSLHGKRNTEHDPPYWRGPVWMNVNYLMLAALDHYSKVDGPQAFAAKKLHNTLREALLKTVSKAYLDSGYLWENYDEELGQGRGCRPFTGWTALLALIASESYPQM